MTRRWILNAWVVLTISLLGCIQPSQTLDVAGEFHEQVRAGDFSRVTELYSEEFYGVRRQTPEEWRQQLERVHRELGLLRLVELEGIGTPSQTSRRLRYKILYGEPDYRRLEETVVVNTSQDGTTAIEVHALGLSPWYSPLVLPGLELADFYYGELQNDRFNAVDVLTHRKSLAERQKDRLRATRRELGPLDSYNWVDVKSARGSHILPYEITLHFDVKYANGTRRESLWILPQDDGSFRIAGFETLN